MIGLEQAFSGSYAQARMRFLEGAARAGLPITTQGHPLPGATAKRWTWQWRETRRPTQTAPAAPPA